MLLLSCMMDFAYTHLIFEYTWLLNFYIHLYYLSRLGVQMAIDVIGKIMTIWHSIAIDGGITFLSIAGNLGLTNYLFKLLQLN